MGLRYLAVAMILLSMGPAAAAQSPRAEDATDSLEGFQRRLREQQERLDELEQRLAENEQAIREAEQAQTLPPWFAKTAEWLADLSFFADLRLRYDGQFTESEKDRHRGRYRLRFGFGHTWFDDQLETAFRLASGDVNTPASTFQTFGGDFNRDDIRIDLAYARIAPAGVPGLTAAGGKMPNPLVHTLVIWDSDVNPEGFWTQYKLPRHNAAPFVNVGYWLLQQNDDAHDATLASYQVGLDAKTANCTWTAAATYYDYDDYADNFVFAGGNPVAGGRLAAGQFHLLNLTGKVRFAVADLPIEVIVDYVYNCGASNPLPTFENQDTGYALGVVIGTREQKGDWLLGYTYAWIEADATVGAFVDATFGGTNTQGHVLAGAYVLADNITLVGQFFRLSPIVAEDDQATYIVVVDLVWEF